MKQHYVQRVLETNTKIFNAFVQMMQETPLHQISISELCSQAGINRSTFYHHFGSQYDVLAELTERFLGELEEMLQSASSHDKEDMERRVALCFSYAAQHKDVALLLMQNNSGTSFAERLFSLPGIVSLLDEKFSALPDALERNACISFVTHGAYQLLTEWLNAPDRIPAEEEAALILRLARKLC